MSGKFIIQVTDHQMVPHSKVPHRKVPHSQVPQNVLEFSVPTKTRKDELSLG